VVTATVQIAPVNDPPRLDLNGEGQAGQNTVVYYDENAAGNAGELLLAPDLWLEDVDNTALDGAELMLEPRPNGSAEFLAARTTGTNITAVYNKATGTLLLSGRDTVANYRKTLGSATYNNTQPFANRALRTVRFRVRDGTSTSDGRRATVVIRPQYAFFPFLAREVTGPLPTGEPNNICADAFPLVSNRSYEFDANDVNDWYRFTLEQSGKVTVQLTEFAPQEGQMLVASGECGDLVRIGHNGDFAETKVIRLGVLAPETYYIWVINDGPTAEGSPYNLAILVE
jgi:hypothetical protein